MREELSFLYVSSGDCVAGLAVGAKRFLLLACFGFFAAAFVAHGLGAGRPEEVSFEVSKHVIGEKKAEAAEGENACGPKEAVGGCGGDGFPGEKDSGDGGKNDAGGDGPEGYSLDGLGREESCAHVTL